MYEGDEILPVVSSSDNTGADAVQHQNIAELAVITAILVCFSLRLYQRCVLWSSFKDWREGVAHRVLALSW